MPFENIGIAIKGNRRRSKSPIRYFVSKSGTNVKITISKEILEKCKFADKYCRLLFDPDDLRIRIEVCEDQYEKGSYKWHSTPYAAFVQFAMPHKNICPLPTATYSISKFSATSKIIEFTFLNVDIVKKAAKA